MNLFKPLRTAHRVFHSLSLRCRLHLPRQQCQAFVERNGAQRSGIVDVYIINLERQPGRLADLRRELEKVVDAAGDPLEKRVIRFAACDAQAQDLASIETSDIGSTYTLADQLFVEPQPEALPEEFDLTRPIKMSAAETAVARSHIDVWKKIADSASPYSLVLEDDVWFERGFGQVVDKAWREMQDVDGDSPTFDLLYLSYKEVKHGAPKTFLSENVFRPERGLWYLSGYVLSKKGAQRLLKLLPCRGPVDLWINHKFQELDVRAVRRSVINQRLDLQSTNSYSILPVLTQIGVLDDGDPSLFKQRPTEFPVFAFGAPGSGLSSLAMALSMLGYRCCSDLDNIPERELDRLLTGDPGRIFDAYVNVASLSSHMHTLRRRYPRAKFIVLEGALHHRSSATDFSTLEGADVLHLGSDDATTWGALCEHVRLAPPSSPYPIVPDLGQQRIRHEKVKVSSNRSVRQLRHDPSPWIAESRLEWLGVNINASKAPESSALRTCFEDNLNTLDAGRWLIRNDTFPGNLGLFRPGNVSAHIDGGLWLTVLEEPLGVRGLSAAAISSRERFLFGRFEVTLQATNIPGLVTGFFLHRDSPRQEIDIEITGDRPDRLLVNVFYNPGAEGAKFDYGYRGTPVSIPLGFDASKAPHRFAIEWDPSEIRWLVDGVLVHRRAIWNPTPIPHLPMTLHVNTWPTRSKELAGRLQLRALPGAAILRRIAVDANKADACCQGPYSASFDQVTASLSA